VSVVARTGSGGGGGAITIIFTGNGSLGNLFSQQDGDALLRHVLSLVPSSSPAKHLDLEAFDLAFPEHNATCNPCEQSCTVCLDEFHEGSKYRMLSCGHAFHVGCIDRWIVGGKATGNDCDTDRCPNCRAAVVLPEPKKAAADEMLVEELVESEEEEGVEEEDRFGLRDPRQDAAIRLRGAEEEEALAGSPNHVFGVSEFIM